jgi:hypothetical protein
LRGDVLENGGWDWDSGFAEDGEVVVEVVAALRKLRTPFMPASRAVVWRTI